MEGVYHSIGKAPGGEGKHGNTATLSTKGVVRTMSTRGKKNPELLV